MIYNSLRLRCLLGGACISICVMAFLMPGLHAAFDFVLERSVKKTLRAEVSAIYSSLSFVDGSVSIPRFMLDNEYNELEFGQYSFVHSKRLGMIWKSFFDGNVAVDPLSCLTVDQGFSQVFVQGAEFVCYKRILKDSAGDVSIVSLQPMEEFRDLHDDFIFQLYLWVGIAIVLLLLFLYWSLSLGFRSMERLSVELDALESGRIEKLGGRFPTEVSRLVLSLNRLLDSESKQRERFRNSLDDLAHSLRTPLMVLQGAVSLMVGQRLSSDMADTIKKQIDRMSSQIEYQLQRASRRRTGLIRYRVPFAPVVNDLVAALDRLFADKNVYLESSFDSDVLVPMEPGDLLEVMGNLLDNAFRLCFSRVRISVKFAEGVCNILVEDDGPGVPVEARERILLRGERLDVRDLGCGIGMAVVNDIVDSYGGKILVGESDLGGAQFIVELPVF
ncbi:MAG TPA: ATP-binding protein [Pseudomonas sp.]